MSNPTTPFGWQMPENTDLVTDLPADFEVFGQAVATDLQYLLGGTTGQVLAKASATDLDFVWSADAAGMTNPMTTTGDVIYSSPGSTPVRLGIGTANQLLRVNSGATAPEWATISSGGMTLLSTTTLTGASVTISSISGDYTNLAIFIEKFLPATDAAAMRLRFNGDSGSSYADTGNSFAPVTQTFTSTELSLTQAQDNAVTQSLISMVIPNYANANTWKIVQRIAVTNNQTTTTQWNLTQRTGIWNGTAAINSIYLDTDGGNFTSGTVYIYGVK